MDKIQQLCERDNLLRIESVRGVGFLSFYFWSYKKEDGNYDHEGNKITSATYVIHEPVSSDILSSFYE